MKLLDQLLEILSEGEKPNRFTKSMGDLIRKAREEASLSQRQLAELIYRRQAALSEMENGLMQPDAETLLLLSDRLKKPIVYFYPSPWKPDPLGEDLNEKEKELPKRTCQCGNEMDARLNTEERFKSSHARWYVQCSRCRTWFDVFELEAPIKRKAIL